MTACVHERNGNVLPSVAASAARTPGVGSNEAWLKILDSLPAAIYTTDAQGRITYFNPACVRFSGRTPRVGVDHWCVTWKLFHPDGRPMRHDECPMASAIKEGRPVRGDVAIAERPDGSRVWFEPYPTPLFDQSGGLLGGINMLVNITERKRSEQADREKDERYRRTLALMPAAVYTCDATGAITYYNELAARLWGRSPRIGDGGERFCGSAELILPDGRSMRHEECPMAVALREGRAFRDAEVTIRRPDGTTVQVMVNIDPVLDEHGRVVGAINSFHDVSAIKRAERELRERQVWLAGQREALEAAVNGAPLEESLGTLVRTAVEAIGGGARAGFYLANEEGTALRHVVGMPRDYAEAVDGFKVGPDSLACGLATATGRAILTSDVREDALWQPWLWMAEKFDYRACWSFPIHTAARKFVGTMAIYSREPREATERDQEIGRLLTDTASIIVSRHKESEARRRTEAALRESESRLAGELAGMTRLHELSVRLAGQDDLEHVMHEVMSAARELLGAERCTAQLADAEEGSLRLVAAAGFDQAFMDRFAVVTKDGFTTCAAALRRGEQVVVEDLASSNEFAELGRIAVPLGVRAAMSTPLLAGDGNLLGVFTTYWEREHRPGEHQLRLLDLYVQQAARQVERRKAEDALRESEERLEAEVQDLETLRRLSLRVAATNDRTEALNDVLDTAIAMVGAAKGNVQLYDASDDTLRIIAHRGFNEEFLEYFKSVPLGYSCCGAAMAGRERVIVEDVFTDPRFNDLAEVYARHGFVAVQSTPLFTSDGRLLGMFSTHFARPHRLTERDLRLLDQIAQHAGRVIERTLAEEALRQHRDRLQELVEERTREILEAQQRVRMSERMASLGTLSAGLGHDMGNLLLPVRVRLETLAQMGLPEAAAKELAGIRGSLEYLQRLAGGLRQLAVDPARAPCREPTELTSWWSEAATVLKNTLPRGAQLEGEMPLEECWVQMPRAALTQAVFNLVQNAGDALRERGTGTVTVGVESGPEHVHISVSDDGPGMTEETTRRCMEPFYTTKTRGVSTGLGLALVYGLVQEAGGTVELRSERGRGTTFTLRLARAQSPERVAGPRRLAVVNVKDARWRAIVSAELESLSYELAASVERAGEADLVVADCTEAGVAARAQLVLLADANGAPESAIALGERPRIQVLRDTLRAVTVRRGEEAARP